MSNVCFIHFFYTVNDIEGIKMKQISIVQSLSQMREEEEEAEKEAETDERNVGTLRVVDHLKDSQQNLFTHRYN